MPVMETIGAAANIAGQIYDIASQRGRAEQAYHRQKRLWDVQDEHQRQMAEFNQANAMEMWKATGPVGQMQQLKEAGLNPALIYGMGGAGGQTANTPQADSANSGSATIQQQMSAQGMGLQLAQMKLLAAQTENVNAQTNKTNAEAQNLPLTAENIQAGTENTKANTALTNTNNEIAKLNQQYQNATLEQSIANFSTEASRIMSEARQALTNANITGATQEDQINQIKANLATTLVTKALTEQKTKESKSYVELNTAQIKQIENHIAQAWEGLHQGDEQIAINKFKTTMDANYPGLFEVLGRQINDAIQILWKKGGEHKGEHMPYQMKP